MYAPPPEANCIKIYSYHCKNQIDFYDKLGMLFTKTTTEDGRMCHTYIYDDFHFVIQEVSSELEASRNLELRFFIDEIEIIINILIVLVTILTLGIVASRIASQRITQKLINN